MKDNGKATTPLTPLTTEQLLQNGEDCNIAASRLYGHGNAIAAGLYEVASALYRCTSHLAATLSLVLVETCDREVDDESD